jgi:hypothetical protein
MSQPGKRRIRLKYDTGSHHRPGQRATAGFINPGHAAIAFGKQVLLFPAVGSLPPEFTMLFQLFL